MNKRKILIDCDPGHDDAIMLMIALANKDIDILGIVSESGNQTVEKTTQNIINVISFLGREDIKVAKGLSHPIINEPRICPEIHGESGLDGFIFPKYNKKAIDMNGIDFIIQTLLNNNDVTIITTGPTTNIAVAILSNPSIKSHIKEIIMMGGSSEGGNISKYAEFNVLVDPEAFYIIVNSGIKVKMVGLNITRQVLVTNSIIERMNKINNKASDMFTKLMIVFNQNQKKTFNLDAGPLHDPVTIISFLDESIIEYKHIYVDININHDEKSGETICDFDNKLNKKPNCYYGVNIDTKKYWDIVENSLKFYNNN